MDCKLLMPRDVLVEIENVVSKLKRQQIAGSHLVAVTTTLLYRFVVSKWTNHSTLILAVKEVGRRLTAAAPTELVLGNIMRRVLHIIREESFNVMLQEEEDEGHDGSKRAPDVKGGDASHVIKHKEFSHGDHVHFGASGSLGSSSGLFGMLADGYGLGSSDLNPSDTGSTSAEASVSANDHLNNYNLKPLVIEGIKELLEELEHVHSTIATQSLEYIHFNEFIMTLGQSRTVESFLKFAAKRRKFTVMVAEGAPGYSGHPMAISLAQAGIEVVLIPDSAIFAVMSRVNKVILGCHAVTANGGVIAACGSNIVAKAARYHSLPVVICTGMFKLSPIYPYDTDAFNKLVDPDPTYSFEDGDAIGETDVINPYYDYVPPELVSLFITNLGSHPTTYMYRVLQEQFSHEDITMEELRQVEAFLYNLSSQNGRDR